MRQAHPRIGRRHPDERARWLAVRRRTCVRWRRSGGRAAAQPRGRGVGGRGQQATDLRRGGPARRVLVEAGQHRRPDGLGQTREVGLAFGGAPPAVGRRSGRERRAPGGREREHGAEREDVGRGARPDPARPHTARPHTTRAGPARAEATARTRRRRLGRLVPGRAVARPGRRRQAEPDQPRAVLGEDDRRRREVAVRGSGGVHRGEPGRETLGQRDRARLPQRAALVDELLQRGPGDVDLGPPRRVGRGVDVDDGRHEPQRGRGGGPRLRGEPLPEPGARRDGGVHEREHDGPAGGVRAEQRAAGRDVGERPQDLVGPERGGVLRRGHGTTARSAIP